MVKYYKLNCTTRIVHCCVMSIFRHMMMVIMMMMMSCCPSRCCWPIIAGNFWIFRQRSTPAHRAKNLRTRQLSCCDTRPWTSSSSVYFICRENNAKAMCKLTRGQSNLTKSASRGPIPRLGVTPGGRKLYH